MKEELSLIKELKEKTLEEIIKKYSKGFGELDKMNLSIWDVREILYKETKKIADRIVSEERVIEDASFRRDFD